MTNKERIDTAITRIIFGLTENNPSFIIEAAGDFWEDFNHLDKRYKTSLLGMINTRVDNIGAFTGKGGFSADVEKAAKILKAARPPISKNDFLKRLTTQ